MHQPGRCLQCPRVPDSWGSRASRRGWVNCSNQLSHLWMTRIWRWTARVACAASSSRAKMTPADNKQTNTPAPAPSPSPKVGVLRSWLGLERERWASHFSAQGRRILVSGTFWAPRGFRGDSQRSSRARKLTFTDAKYVFWALLGFSKDT
jgi:hypothetical protein